ncbi:MAG: pantoate--beta-alanine ligase [Chthoniobacteraceae bacterium]
MLALDCDCQYSGPFVVKVVRTIPAIRRLCGRTRERVVLVPTMGALHAGHAALIARARRMAGAHGIVVVSIFVNPTQFGPMEDLSRYPRPFAADRRLCEEHGGDVVFYPSVKEMYPAGFSTFVEEQVVSSALCGTSRPGHFRGVCTVVLKLFTIIEPDIAVFGQKDFQQCAVIRRVVRDLNLPVRIAAMPTVRDRDGLALSSRNAYLTPEERAQAPVIRRALRAARDAWRSGEKRSARLRQIVARQIARAPLAKVDYIDVVDADSIQPVAETCNKALIASAVFFGKTRLIDNIVL